MELRYSVLSYACRRNVLLALTMVELGIIHIHDLKTPDLSRLLRADTCDILLGRAREQRRG